MTATLVALENVSLQSILIATYELKIDTFMASMNICPLHAVLTEVDYEEGPAEDEVSLLVNDSNVEGWIERSSEIHVMQALRIHGNNTGSSDWAYNLWHVEHAHNFAQSTWTDKSTFEMLHGKWPIEVPPVLPESLHPAVERYLDDLVTQQWVAHLRWSRSPHCTKRQMPREATDSQIGRAHV